MPSPHGRAVAFTSGLCALPVVSLPLGESDASESTVGRVFGHANSVTAVALHPFLNVLATGSLDQTINSNYLAHRWL